MRFISSVVFGQRRAPVVLPTRRSSALLHDTMPVARAAGYTGSARNLRRAVAKMKRDWRQKRRLYRPWVATSGQHLVIDWTRITAGLHMFCAVLAWSRYRFVRFAADETRETTLGLIAECFEELGAVTAVVLSDRMACLKNGVVANVVVPENNFGGNIAEGNRQGKLWGIEVNGRRHSETQAVPAERLEQERQLMRPLPSLRPALCRGELRKVNKTQTIRFGSARYSLPTEWVGKVVEVSVVDHLADPL